MDYVDLLESAVLEMSGLSRIQRYIATNTCGIMTAFRGNLTKSENLRRNAELKSQLRNLGYSVTPVKGAYIEDFAGIDPQEVSEDSLFVANQTIRGDDAGQLLSDLTRVAQRFDQDSILYIPHGGAGTLVGTSERSSAYPGMGVEVEQGEFLGLSQAALSRHPFLSRVRNRPFGFTDDRSPSGRED